MCSERGLQPTLEMSDKSWKKYNKIRSVVRGILSPSSTHTRDGRLFKRTLYAAVAIVAFSLGVSVGLTIPFFILNETNAMNVRIHTVNRTLPKADFNSVSFVTNSPTTSTPPNREYDRFKPTQNGLVDGVFWSDEVEATLPTGYGEPEAERWRRFVNTSQVVKIEEGCGRMQNRLLTYEDGTRACCRYRQNTDQIQGELFSFYLGRVLGLSNLAPSSLGVIQSKDDIWSKVKAEISLAQWAEERPVVLTKYIDHLQPAQIPRSLRTTSRRLHPRDIQGDKNRLIELAQWSDLIIFDYLTANLDRIVNNLYNLQWNPGMMDAPAHNLAKHASSKLLVFLDNESGLLHGYRLLDKYESYHSDLLNALCVFRRSTVERIDRLRRDKNVGSLLNGRLEEYGHRDVLPSLPEKSIKILKDRLDRVHDQVEWCKQQYSEERW